MDNEAQWTQLIDPSSGNPYYVNSVTNETVWDQPEGWVDPATLEAGGGGVDPAEVAQWETHFDETSQQTYWYNKGSGEVSEECRTCLLFLFANLTVPFPHLPFPSLPTDDLGYAHVPRGSVRCCRP